MSRLDELVTTGHRRLRLPEWNPHAYIEPDLLSDGNIGPWTTLYDMTAGIGSGEPIRLLTVQCDEVDAWEAIGS